MGKIASLRGTARRLTTPVMGRRGSQCGSWGCNKTPSREAYEHVRSCTVVRSVDRRHRRSCPPHLGGRCDEWGSGQGRTRADGGVECPVSRAHRRVVSDRLFFGNGARRGRDGVQFPKKTDPTSQCTRTSPGSAGHRRPSASGLVRFQRRSPQPNPVRTHAHRSVTRIARNCPPVLRSPIERARGAK